MNLPTKEQSLKYFVDYVVPRNIYKHCLAVNSVANFLAKKLTETGININLELVDRVSLLHDLFKVVTFKELKSNKYHKYEFNEEEIAMWKKLREKYAGMYEGDVAYEIFHEEFPNLALTLKRASDPRNENPSWEELIVHYADWRIFKEEIVTLDNRLSYLQEMYPHDQQLWDKYIEKIRSLENKIFKKLDFDADGLNKSFKEEKENSMVEK
jgi:hypothetical protein